MTRDPIDRLSEIADSLRAVWQADLPWVESLGALAEIAHRLATGDLTPAALWSFHAANTPDRLAIADARRRVTWAELDRRANRLANALLGLGLQPGDRVAIMIENSVEWFEALAACQKIGAATVFVSYRFTPPEVRYLLENSHASVFVFGAAEAAVAREVAATRSAIPSGCYVAIGAAGAGGFADYETLLAGASDREPPADLRRTGSRTILYTSGTTGKPKGAVRDLSKAGAATALGLLRRIPFRGSDRHLVAAPLYHATGSGFATVHLLLGSPIHLLPRFDAREFLRVVDRERITTSALVPTMLRALVELPDAEFASFDVTSLRVLVTTGSALPDALARAVSERFGDVLYDLYGSTEMGYVTVATPEDKRAAPGTIGRPMPGVEVALLDERRRPVADGEVGELFARSEVTFEGYHANEAATAASRYEGFFSVGDLAVRDPHGYLRLVGRKTDMVISGGMNVYPAEIEAVLAAHPKIREAAVVGVPDEKWGEALVAFVVARDGASRPADEELVEFAKRSLAGYKVPRRFRWIDGLPRNPTGKVLKQDLRAEGSPETRTADPSAGR